MMDEQEGLLGDFQGKELVPEHHARFNISRRQPTTLAILATLSTILSLAALTVAVLLFQKAASHDHHSTNANWLPEDDIPNCGSSPAEAKALGCHFDIMMLAWQPPLCYDAELLDETFPTGRWEFFHDKNFTQPVDEEVVRAGTTLHPLFSSPDFHYEHCAYVWKKQMRAYAGKYLIDTKAFSYGHTVHCADLLTPRLPYIVPYTQVNTSYLSCVRP